MFFGSSASAARKGGIGYKIIRLEFRQAEVQLDAGQLWIYREGFSIRFASFAILLQVRKVDTEAGPSGGVSGAGFHNLSPRFYCLRKLPFSFKGKRRFRTGRIGLGENRKSKNGKEKQRNCETHDAARATIWINEVRHGSVP